ncbi:MAG: DivIVA domain-containing protein, partial [Spirosomaceae bacterium]|nr:DivIVA domain-containing protein [Spirosomataceae bacterium]
MKITPLELRQFEFEKTFRGYSIEEVDMFINNLAQEWERVLTETKMMRMQLELAEKEAAKLRELEMTLFKTLKTAEDTSTMITEQANQQAAKNLSEASVIAEQQVADAQMQANKYLAEAKMQAEQILSNARLNANAMMQQADEQSRYVKEDVLSDVRAIENDFNSLVNYKEQLLAQMRGFATATVEHVERFEGKFDIQAIESKIQKANELVAVTPKEEENNITEEATEIDDVLVEMSVEEVTTEELEIEEEVLDNKVLTEEEVDEVVETFDEGTD